MSGGGSRRVAILLATVALVAASTLFTAELAAASEGSWTSAGNMTSGRQGATATLLPNGKVLVAGGRFGAGPTLASTDLYDPATNAWSSAGTMRTSRAFYTATLLPNGKVLVAGGFTFDGSSFHDLSSAELYNPATNTWSSTGSMATARAAHTATLLLDGEVLVAGGFTGDPSKDLRSAEVYDPATRTWSAAGKMTISRVGHSATLLPNGKVLVAGGSTDAMGSTAYLDTAELYNPTRNTWSKAATMTAPRLDHTATLLGNGEVLVAAGNISGSGTAELYHPTDNTWTGAGTLSVNRVHHTATLLGNGEVLVAGGFNGSFLDSAELYDPVRNVWSSAGTMATPRELHTATLLRNGKVLVAGGNNDNSNATSLSSAELYQPATNTWSAAASMTASRWQPTATLLHSGKVLVAGGFDTAPPYLASAEVYDPTSNTWAPAGSMSEARFRHTATLLDNGKVLVVGGESQPAHKAVILSSADLYNPASNSWSPAASLATPRENATATLLGNGKVLVAGGNNLKNPALASAQLYNPATNTWSSARPMAQGRNGAASVRLGNGKVLVVGGNGGAGHDVASAELYNPATNKWTSAGSMATAREFPTITMLGTGKVLVAGGNNTSIGPLASAELYNPATNKWSSAGSMITGRSTPTATLLPNGDVLVAGGFGPPGSNQQEASLSSAEVYDPAKNAWTPAGSMATGRYGHTATLLGDGEVLVAGGVDQSGQSFSVLKSAELYEPDLTFPAVTGTKPASAPVGKKVTVKGRMLGRTFDAWIDGVEAPFTVLSDFAITVTVPNGALTGPLALMTPQGIAWEKTIKVQPTVASFSPAKGPPGTSVTITGKAFTGDTKVEFNGTAATFHVTSYSEIKATVPHGATTGRITVFTPGGKGTSTASFTVT